MFQNTVSNARLSKNFGDLALSGFQELPVTGTIRKLDNILDEIDACVQKYNGHIESRKKALGKLVYFDWEVNKVLPRFPDKLTVKDCMDYFDQEYLINEYHEPFYGLSVKGRKIINPLNDIELKNMAVAPNSPHAGMVGVAAEKLSILEGSLRQWGNTLKDIEAKALEMTQWQEWVLSDDGDNHFGPPAFLIQPESSMNNCLERQWHYNAALTTLCKTAVSESSEFRSQLARLGEIYSGMDSMRQSAAGQDFSVPAVR
ncbi:MAG: hypothetical protein JWO78_769 [Micavibrio sp.]|nr:hypothetical protein [Micavibrio sp.]